MEKKANDPLELNQMILCVYSGREAHYVSAWEEFFQDADIQAELLPINKNWKKNPDFFQAIFNSSHLLIIVTKKITSTTWFKFLSGFCLGKNCPLFLYLGEPDIELAPYLTYAECGESIEDLKKYLARTSIQQKKQLVITTALDELKKRGIYFTPEHFFLCIQQNDSEAVELFLKAEFSPDAATNTGVPALCLAARHGFNEICTLLLNYGCDVNAISKDSGNNALMEAATNRNASLAKLFLEHGSKPDVQSKNNQTALMLAVGRGDVELVELLLQARADLELKDNLGMTAEQYAKVFKYEKIETLFANYK